MYEVEFAVGKETGSSDTAENIARTAFNAAVIFDWTEPFERWFAFFDEQYFEIGMFAKIEGGKKSSWTTANDYYIIAGALSSFSHVNSWFSGSEKIALNCSNTTGREMPSRL
jgi:hypothetical protein